MIFKPSTIAAGIAGVAIVALITYFNPMSGQGTSINLSVLNIGLIIYVFIAAMFAISAMVLPGISGSTLLLIFGLYVPIISAVKSVITFDFAYLPILIVFALGILTGAASVVRIIKWALDKHRPIMIFLIIGMMIGSFYAIIMGPMTLETPKDPLSFLWFGNTIDCGFPRPLYTESVASYLGSKVVKVLTGQRRVGKSYILRQTAMHLVQQGVSSNNIVFINVN